MGSYVSGDGSKLVLLRSEYFMQQNSSIINQIIESFRFIDDGSMIIHSKQQFLGTSRNLSAITHRNLKLKTM